eukprot:scaffold1184_cov132-Cylindrotheca_fusiformis.AAC.96
MCIANTARIPSNAVSRTRGAGFLGVGAAEEAVSEEDAAVMTFVPPRTERDLWRLLLLRVVLVVGLLVAIGVVIPNAETLV